MDVICRRCSGEFLLEDVVVHRSRGKEVILCHACDTAFKRELKDMEEWQQTLASARRFRCHFWMAETPWYLGTVVVRVVGVPLFLN